MIQLIDYQLAKKIMLGEVEPSCTMYIYVARYGTIRNKTRYVAIDASDRELWVEGFAKLETAILWLLDNELDKGLSAEALRKVEYEFIKSTLSKNHTGKETMT